MKGAQSARPVAEIDSALRVIAAIRALYGGSTELTDRLLDERLECQE